MVIRRPRLSQNSTHKSPKMGSHECDKLELVGKVLLNGRLPGIIALDHPYCAEDEASRVVLLQRNSMNATQGHQTCNNIIQHTNV